MLTSNLKKLSYFNLMILATCVGCSLAADSTRDDQLSGASMESKRKLFQTGGSTLSSPERLVNPNDQRTASPNIKGLAYALDGEAEVRAQKRIKEAEDKAQQRIAEIEQNAIEQILVIQKSVTDKQAELNDLLRLIESKKAELQTIIDEKAKLVSENSVLTNQLETTKADAIVTWSGTVGRVGNAATNAASYLALPNWLSRNPVQTEQKTGQK
jgi:hypothetical protein